MIAPMPLNADLAAELARRLRNDQAARHRWMETKGDTRQMLACDQENTNWLRDIVCRLGWPGVSMVGTAGAEAAWVLAQHADHDVVFQRQCLDLLIEAVDQGEAPKFQVAYLTDRVLLKQREAQRYGTQFRQGASGLERCPSQDTAGLADRRIAVGLSPSEDALAGGLDLAPSVE